MTELEEALDKLKGVILSKPEKKQGILVKWLNKWSELLQKEDKFKPDRLPYYKRGDVLYVDFGFNIGAEFGGVHYAVVVENNNNKRNGNIVVVPLTSLDKGKSKDDIPQNEIYIGDNVLEWTNAATVAKPNQIRAISKMRIIRPVKADEKRKATLNGEQLQLIDDRLKKIIYGADSNET